MNKKEILEKLKRDTGLSKKDLIHTLDIMSKLFNNPQKVRKKKKKEWHYLSWDDAIEVVYCILEESYIDIKKCEDCPTQCINYKKRGEKS